VTRCFDRSKRVVAATAGVARAARDAYSVGVMRQDDGALDVPKQSGGPAPPGLRGRDQEIGQVVGALEGALSGQPSLVVVSGEPGIGKTALTQTVVEHAARLGFRTAYSAALEEDAVTPLASLGPALRFGSTPLITSAPFMDLAALNDQPLWLAEQLAVLLEEQADQSPLLLALDDAQWFDPLTRFVLRVLPGRLRASRIIWLLATRSLPGGGQVQTIIDAARPEVKVLPLDLSPLSEDAVLAMAQDRFGTSLDAVMERDLSQGRGNPFLTVQILEGLYESSADGGTGSGGVPHGLIDGIRHRMAATTDDCRHLVRTAAVLGQSFVLSDVAAIDGPTSPALITDALLEAINIGLLTDDGVSIRFRHELLRHAVYEDIPPSARNAVHRTYADLLIAEGRGYATAAPHMLAVATQGDAQAVEVLRRAAHEVSNTMVTTSVRFIQQAFDLTSEDDPIRGDIGVEAVAILGAAREFEDATRFAERLLADGLPAALSGEVRLLLLPRLWALGCRPKMADLARQPSGAAALDARLEGYRRLAGDDEPAVTQGLGDPIASVLAVLSQAEQTERRDDRQQALSLFASARSLAAGVDGYGVPEAGDLAARELAAVARSDRIDDALQGLDDEGNFPSSWQAPQLALLRAQFHLGAGRVEEAAVAASTAADLMQDVHDFSRERDLHQILATIALHRDDRDTARKHLTAATNSGEDLPLIRAVLDRADGTGAGGAELVEALCHDDAWWPEDWLIDAACSAHHDGDRLTFDAAAREVALRARRNPDVPSLIGADLLLSALSMGDFTDARAVLDGCQRALVATRVDEEFGRATLDHDRNTAVAALDAARDRYTELGAVGAAARVQRVLQAAGVRRRRWAAVARRPDSGWDALTVMERRIALLVAEGHTNRSAAEELVLSPSTINTHLRAVFTKLDVHSRVQLANVARERRNDAAAPEL
jgi:DNA-binding CsgD family transcriptional regulator